MFWPLWFMQLASYNCSGPITAGHCGNCSQVLEERLLRRVKWHSHGLETQLTKCLRCLHDELSRARILSWDSQPEVHLLIKGKCLDIHELSKLKPLYFRLEQDPPIFQLWWMGSCPSIPACLWAHGAWPWAFPTPQITLSCCGCSAMWNIRCKNMSGSRRHLVGPACLSISEHLPGSQCSGAWLSPPES